MVTIYGFETEQACSIAFESGEGGGQTHPILFLNLNLRKLVAARTCASPMLRACRKIKIEFKNELV